jgi:hypothetical protein
MVNACHTIQIYRIQMRVVDGWKDREATGDTLEKKRWLPPTTTTNRYSTTQPISVGPPQLHYILDRGGGIEESNGYWGRRFLRFF